MATATATATAPTITTAAAAPAAAPPAPSAARVAANRLNARRSTGPRTAEGKARSRANAVKHGLAGAGVALPTEDRERVEERFLRFQEDLAPRDVAGMVLAREMALMSVRLDRAARHEAAALADAVARAAVERDLARLAEVDRLLAAIVQDPGPIRRRLETTPEGVDRLLAALAAARDQVRGGQARSWGEDERAEVEAFFGRKRVFFPISRTSALLEAIRGDDRWFAADDPIHQLDPALRQSRARAELGRIIDDELARLAARRAEFDPAALAADRARAADLALNPADPAALLARKYEADASRRFHRALRDFHHNEACPAAADAGPPDADPAVAADPPASPVAAPAPAPARAEVRPEASPVIPPDEPGPPAQFEGDRRNEPTSPAGAEGGCPDEPNPAAQAGGIGRNEPNPAVLAGGIGRNEPTGPVAPGRIAPVPTGPGARRGAARPGPGGPDDRPRP